MEKQEEHLMSRAYKKMNHVLEEATQHWKYVAPLLAYPKYDEKNFQIKGIKGVNALKYLMELRQLNQSDLHDIGSQGVISEILNGKRTLNLRQIKIASHFF